MYIGAGAFGTTLIIDTIVWVCFGFFFRLFFFGYFSCAPGSILGWVWEAKTRPKIDFLGFVFGCFFLSFFVLIFGLFFWSFLVFSYCFFVCARLFFLSFTFCKKMIFIYIFPIEIDIAPFCARWLSHTFLGKSSMNSGMYFALLFQLILVSILVPKIDENSI